MTLLLCLTLIFLALLLGDFGVFVVRRGAASQNLPIALHFFIMAGCLRVVDTQFLALGDCLSLCFQPCKPRVGFPCAGVRCRASSNQNDGD